MEELFKKKIENMSEYLISVCNNKDKIKDIRESLTDLPLYKIILFINFLDKNKMDDQVSDFIKLYSLNDNQETKDKIIEYLNYFLEVKDILNQ